MIRGLSHVLSLNVVSVGGELVGRMKVHVFECPLVCDVRDSKPGMCQYSGRGMLPGGRHGNDETTTS